MKVYQAQRDVVLVSGDEAETYLQGQISQDVLGLAEGSSAWSFILQPQGKVDAWFRITRTGDDSFVLDVDAGFGEQLLARLKRFKLRTKADLALETWDWHAFIADGDAPNIALPEGSILAASASGMGVDLIGAELPATDADPIAADEYELFRIKAGIPAMGSELDDGTIPAEARIVERSVSFTKGCYTGQELVARVDSRGDNTPRKLRVISGAGHPVAGAMLTLDGNDAGALTSVAFDGDGFAALAYIKRSALDATELALAGESVSVSPVPHDVGAT